jgi:hypothetical protein
MRPFDANDAVAVTESCACGFDEQGFDGASFGQGQIQPGRVTSQPPGVALDPFDPPGADPCGRVTPDPGDGPRVVS